MSDVRGRHRPVPAEPTEEYNRYCPVCFVQWPCDAIQMADDADRLAAALRRSHRSLEEFNGGRGTLFPGAYSLDHPAGTYENCDYCDALRQHEEGK